MLPLPVSASKVVKVATGGHILVKGRQDRISEGDASFCEARLSPYTFCSHGRSRVHVDDVEGDEGSRQSDEDQQKYKEDDHQAGDATAFLPLWCTIISCNPDERSILSRHLSVKQK